MLNKRFNKQISISHSLFVKNFKSCWSLSTFFVIISIIEIYAFQAVKTFTKVRPDTIAYAVISALAIAFIFYEFTKFVAMGQLKMTMFNHRVDFGIGSKLILTIYVSRILYDWLLVTARNYFVDYDVIQVFYQIEENLFQCLRNCSWRFYRWCTEWRKENTT
jgi:hypothetical protein